MRAALATGGPLFIYDTVIEGRILVTPALLGIPPCRWNDALGILIETFGFHPIEVDLVQEARERKHLSSFRLGADMAEAPAVVDCASLMKWLFALVGITLPRTVIEQRKVGTRITGSVLQAGDLIFMLGRRNEFDEQTPRGVGHVGLCTGVDTVIHAKTPERGIVEDSLDRYLGMLSDEFPVSRFRGVCRVLPPDMRVLRVPAHLDVRDMAGVRRLLEPRLIDLP